MACRDLRMASGLPRGKEIMNVVSYNCYFFIIILNTAANFGRAEFIFVDAFSMGLSSPVRMLKN